MEGFLYPNEAEIQWSLLIVLYPYITGLVAGAFIVSALHQVFGIRQLEKVARLSLITALSFVVVAPLPLLGHLGHPERGFNIFFTPHFTSAMAGFGYIWLFYFVLLLVEIWLVFRSDIVARAHSTHGPKRAVYTLMTLGVLEISERVRHTDEKIVRLLATVGIPSAVVLHGYVGFLFGSIKANPWWSTSLMPIIFLLSAIVSGMALLVVLYPVVARLKRQALDPVCMDALTGWLLGFLLIAVTIELLELISMLYEGEESLDIIVQLIRDRLWLSYLVVQIGMGSVTPAVILTIARKARLPHAAKHALAMFASSLILVGVLSMRWNVVIGGQLISKSLRGLNSYVPPLFGTEGALVAVAFMVMPFVIFAVLIYFLPPWEQPALRPAGPPTREPTRWGAWGVPRGLGRR